jgi:uncharacterized protein (UPF0335 family)
MTKKLSNAGTVKRAAIDRMLRIHSEMDGLKEELKDLKVELKGREDEIGCSIKELAKAVALHRQGAGSRKLSLDATIALLTEAGLHEEAADAALS